MSDIVVEADTAVEVDTAAGVAAQKKEPTHTKRPLCYSDFETRTAAENRMRWQLE